MSKEDLEATKDGLHLILQGISCRVLILICLPHENLVNCLSEVANHAKPFKMPAGRLENPLYLIRKMASAIALVFSKIIDPKNPLYLDDSCQEDTIDWEFGLATPRKVPASTTPLSDEKTHERENRIQNRQDKGVDNTSKTRKEKESVFNLIDPDEIIDPANLNNECTFNEYESDNASEDSESSGDSALQPYDLTDDDADLKKKFSQLVDVVGALRKSDDAEGVSS